MLCLFAVVAAQSIKLCVNIHSTEYRHTLPWQWGKHKPVLWVFNAWKQADTPDVPEVLNTGCKQVHCVWNTALGGLLSNNTLADNQFRQIRKYYFTLLQNFDKRSWVLMWLTEILRRLAEVQSCMVTFFSKSAHIAGWFELENRPCIVPVPTYDSWFLFFECSLKTQFCPKRLLQAHCLEDLMPCVWFSQKHHGS